MLRNPWVVRPSQRGGTHPEGGSGEYVVVNRALGTERVTRDPAKRADYAQACALARALNRAYTHGGAQDAGVLLPA
ncbi:MAG: hypothetical protein KGL54_15095 [Sphingomonadales bacterium]|nr:hypothetical protein [Sphingomonadales bacterium]